MRFIEGSERVHRGGAPITGVDEGDIAGVEDLDEDVEDLDAGPYRPPNLRVSSPQGADSPALAASSSHGGVPAALHTLTSNAPLSPAQRIKMDIKTHMRGPSEESHVRDGDSSSDPEAELEHIPPKSQKMALTLPRSAGRSKQAPQTGLLARPRSAKSSRGNSQPPGGGGSQRKNGGIKMRPPETRVGIVTTPL